MDKLLDGYQRFRESAWPEQRKLFETLAAKGQRPRALVLGCIDSRVEPPRIFDTAPGELLTVRNVASLVPAYAPDAAYHGTSAALEFGIRVLEVQDLIVLGHGKCGGVQALLNGAPDNAKDFVANWMSIAQPAREKALAAPDGTDRQTLCEHEVIKVSLANLMTFPWISERVEDGRLRLHGGWFDISTGVLEMLQPNGKFEPA